MTTKTDEQERRDFEAWLRSKWTDGYGCPKNADGSYVDPIAQLLWEAYQAGQAALQSQDRGDAFCVWHNDPETDNSWDTSCRQLFEIYDGPPTENGMKFCCYCGKQIREAIDHARRVGGEGE